MSDHGHALQPSSASDRKAPAIHQGTRTKASPSDRQSNGARATSEPTPKPCNRHQGATTATPCNHALLFGFWFFFSGWFSMTPATTPPHRTTPPPQRSSAGTAKQSTPPNPRPEYRERPHHGHALQPSSGSDHATPGIIRRTDHGTAANVPALTHEKTAKNSI